MLDGAQTFIGVLVTLSVLCLFQDQNNFIINFWNHLISEIEEMLKWSIITSTTEDVSEKFRFISDSNNDIFYQRIAQKMTPELSHNFMQSAQAAQMVSTKLWTKKYQIIDDGLNKLNKTGSTEEFEYISLYTFLFGIIVLFVDSFFSMSDLFWAVFIFTFVLSSYAFSTIIWIQFWNSGYENDCPRKHNKWSHIIFFIFIPLLLLIFCPFLKNDIKIPWLCYILLGFSYLILFYFFQRNNFHFLIKNTPNYNRQYILSHFAWILISSLLIGSLYWVLDNSTIINLDVEFYTNFSFYKKSIILFVVLNSVGIPFIVPYLKFYLIRKKISKEIKQEESESWIEINELNTQYDKAVREIRQTIIQQPEQLPSKNGKRNRRRS